MYITVFIGYYLKFEMPTILGVPPTGVWTIILLIYAFIASVLPVTILLQPRDYINAYQLIVAMTLLIFGIFGAVFLKDMSIVAPAFDYSPKNAPPLLPFLFITIACGAISGFHSLVSSGTSSKQVISEKDALFVGYGSMLMEGVLAILVLIAVAGGIGLGFHDLTGVAAFTHHYESWDAAKGLGSKIGAFVIGSSNMISTLGIPQFIGITIMGVFVASFASTTLDSATRIQRYIVTELFVGLKINIFKNRFVATGFAVLSAALLAFITGADGKGALSMWPLFGAVNLSYSLMSRQKN
jgi:carbon starvation protein